MRYQIEIRDLLTGEVETFEHERVDVKVETTLVIDDQGEHESEGSAVKILGWTRRAPYN